jgi:phosphoribosylformylglycinamidine synthase
MKVAILQFPGSNCDWDAEHAVNDVLGIPASRIWHKAALPSETEAGGRAGWFFLWGLSSLWCDRPVLSDYG